MKLESLYAVNLGSVVKVGRSREPKRRIATHSATAAAHGVLVIDTWVGPGHESAAEAETELIRRCRQYAEPIGREYFPIPFEQAVAEAEGIDYASLKTSRNAVDLVAVAKAFLTPGTSGASANDLVFTLLELTHATRAGDGRRAAEVYDYLATVASTEWRVAAIQAAILAADLSPDELRALAGGA